MDPLPIPAIYPVPHEHSCGGMTLAKAGTSEDHVAQCCENKNADVDAENQVDIVDSFILHNCAREMYESCYAGYTNR